MQTPLEIVIYLIDGSIHRFKQDDPAAVSRILETLQPPRVFSQKQILVAGSYFTAGYPTATITRMDLIGAEIGPLRHAVGVVDIEEISIRELDLYAKPRFSDTRRSELVVNVGEATDTVAEINLADTQRIGLKVRYQSESAIDRRQLLQSFAGGLPIHGRRRGGGLVFINPANVIRFSFYPGLPDMPPSSLPLHRAELFGEAAPSMVIKKLDMEEADPG